AFATRLGLPLTRVIQELMKSGILATLNDRIDYETAAIVAEDLGFRASPEVAGVKPEEEAMLDRVRAVLDAEDKTKLVPRPPVVVVMGHVDHGKTKILDAIRKTNVVAGEAGGITQHIGADQAKKGSRSVTFIDTPGHEAFTIMRSRGAKVADVAILVVAADDGVQPQTKEAVHIIQAAKIPFVVALNKIDKPEANLDRVKTQLSELGLVPEDWSGTTIMVGVSAKTGTGIDALLDMVLLVADLDKERIRANPDRLAIGTVIESHLDKGEGPVATVLVQAGTLHATDILGIRGIFYGRVRTMKDWTGAVVAGASPGMPVKVLGFKVAPAVGDIVEVSASSKELEVKKMKPRVVAAEATVSPPPPREEEVAKKTVNVVLRTDMLGSLEAILGMLEKVEHPDVGVKIIGKGLGNVTDADVLQAEAAPGIVLGFNVAILPQVLELAREKNVEVKRFDVIYDLFDEVRRRLEAILPKETSITELGKLEILAVFRSGGGTTIAGGRVFDGKLTGGAKLRIARSSEYVGEGTVLELQSAKQPVREVRAGQECGIKVQSKTPLEVGDRLEAYVEETRVRPLVLAGEVKRR
ncbi:translation initiation factor IF-2, partial [Candidatus Uhrbacteria bacterium]|nr:translation initiation factor IF-2 [Candidatus Uhrbacteria bacterium]